MTHKVRHVNIPIFIPHLGCPNQCVFCNQRTISGVADFDASRVRKQIESHLSTLDADTECEIAFFGGSFTGIDRDLMLSLLKISKEYVDLGRISSVRCSTRPDYINSEIIDLLKQYGVGTVELGLQSIDERVLSLTKRGHTFLDAMLACRMLVDNGIDTVGQMMIGLPGSDIKSELATAQFIIDSGAVGARIYPTVVFTDTELCDMAKMGLYTPLSLEDAVERSARVLEMFVRAGVKVLRIGLCASEGLSGEGYYAGPNHSALGELVESRLYYGLIREKLLNLKLNPGDVPTVLVSDGAVSKAIGHKKENKLKLQNEFCVDDIIVRECESLADYTVIVK